jgi:hypothetical protein
MKEQIRRLENDIFDRPVKNGLSGKGRVKKGSDSERRVCKWLLLWTGYKFIRTPSSGGRRLTNNDTFCGDVVCEDKDFNFIFAVETKHWKDLFMPAELKENSKVYTIWAQADRDAKRAGKETMMVLREDGMATGSYIVFVKRKLAAFLLDRGVKAVSTGMGTKWGMLVGFDNKEMLKVPYSELLAFYQKAA